MADSRVVFAGTACEVVDASTHIHFTVPVEHGKATGGSACLCMRSKRGSLHHMLPICMHLYANERRVGVSVIPAFGACESVCAQTWDSHVQVVQYTYIFFKERKMCVYMLHNAKASYDNPPRIKKAKTLKAIIKNTKEHL